MIDLYPYMERDYKKNEETRAKLKRLKELEQIWDGMLYENERLRNQVKGFEEAAWQEKLKRIP